MKKILATGCLLFMFLLGCLMAACADESSDDTDSEAVSSDSSADTASDMGSDQTVSSDSDSTPPVDSATTTTQMDLGIGSSCACNASTCETLGVPIPGAEGIVGCEDVPANHAGKLVCLRTYAGDLATNTFFANGYCALQAIANCEGAGAGIICDNATIGDYDAMTSCPAGAVLLSKKVTASAMGGALSATMDSKTCVRACVTDADCRVGETDPALG
ncbi:MAG: hypothetical protein JXX14_10600, partial [Deltaproteobacteria bacterium]|nr:hypothetical protein [Deltaproteobacteria bacterium]